MKDRHFAFILVGLFVFFLPGCDIIVGIFKAGFWTAITLVVLLGAVGWYIAQKFRSRK